MTLKASAIFFNILIWTMCSFSKDKLKYSPLDTKPRVVSSGRSWEAAGRSRVTGTRSSESSSPTVFLADKLMIKRHLSNLSVPEKYIYTSWLSPCSTRWVGGVHRLNPNSWPWVSWGLFKVLCFVCSSSPPTLSFLIIFPFGKENPTVSESSRCPCPHRMPATPSPVSPAVRLQTSAIT